MGTEIGTRMLVWGVTTVSDVEPGALPEADDSV